MTVGTPKDAQKLHRPNQSNGGRTVFAFDRDYTIDVNPPHQEDREPVPLEWVSYLAHQTDHIVYATGNQVLKQEATIPGTEEIITAHPDVDKKEGDLMDRIYFDREKRITLLGDLYTDASQLVVVDDVDLSHLNRWDHYFSWDFIPAARSGEIVSELPPAESSMREASHYATPYISDRF